METPINVIDTSLTPGIFLKTVSSKVGSKEGPFKTDQLISKGGKLLIHASEAFNVGTGYSAHLKDIVSTFSIGAKTTIVPKFFGTLSMWYEAIGKVTKDNGKSIVELFYQTLELLSDLVILGALFGINRLFSVIRVFEATNACIDLGKAIDGYRSSDKEVAKYEADLETYNKTSDSKPKDHPIAKGEDPREMRTVYLLKTINKVLSVATGAFTILQMVVPVLAGEALVAAVALPLLITSVLGVVLGFVAKGMEGTTSYKLNQLHNEENNKHLGLSKV